MRLVYGTVGEGMFFQEIEGLPVRPSMVAELDDERYLAEGLPAFAQVVVGLFRRVKEDRELQKDGAEFPVEVSLSYIETEDGVFAIAFVTDITARKKLEEQLLHSQKMEAIGRLAGGVAHDFNNMLTVISGYNRMLLNQLSPMDPLRGYAEEVLKAADRAGALTNQLLAFSRRQVLQPRVLSVNALVAGMEKMVRRLIGEDIDLVIRAAPKAGNLKADPGQIEQVIFNLVVNARDAMPRGGRITIETAAAQLDKQYAKTHLGVQPGEYVLLAVSDTGHGMDAETKRHIFEPFFTTKEQGKGTGLGLVFLHLKYLHLEYIQ
jgi:signal transduction histidine kinase